MILVWLMLIPFLGGLAALASERLSRELPRTIALTVLIIDLLLVLLLILAPDSIVSEDQALLMSFASGERVSDWQVLFTAEWIPRFGINFLFGADGLTLLLIVLTLFLGLMSLGAAWQEINERSGFFYFNLLWTLAGVVGVFIALDLFLFFFLWEVMLVPMYFLIAIWGHERRVYSAIKFFLFTQASSLLMLASIFGLAYVNAAQSGVWTFGYFDLLGVDLAPDVAMWLMLGFFIAFAVKLPVVPLHTWLPDAHTDAPTAGSVILAGVLLKTGAYGLIRFVVPLFPEAAMRIAPFAMTLAVIGILYGVQLILMGFGFMPGTGKGLGDDMALAASWLGWTVPLALGIAAIGDPHVVVQLHDDRRADDPTVDLLTQRLNTHEKYAWMLRSLLE